MQPEDADPWSHYKGQKNGRLAIYSKTDGRKLVETELESPPIYDGMAVAGKNLILSTHNGRIVCFE